MQLLTLNIFFFRLLLLGNSDQWEVNRSDIDLGELLGEGAFATVYKATIKRVSLSFTNTQTSSVTLGHDSCKKKKRMTADDELHIAAAVKMLQRKYKRPYNSFNPIWSGLSLWSQF